MHSTSPQPVQQSPRIHSPAPQAIPAEPVQDVIPAADAVSDRTYARMRDAFILWHVTGCHGAAADYHKARQAWELALMEQGNK